MKIRFTKAWKRGAKVGTVAEMPDGVANLLIRQKKAEPHESVNPSDVRSDVVRAAFVATKQRETHEGQIPESSQSQQTGRRGGNPRKPGNKTPSSSDSGTGEGAIAA